jgi:hypothetical protein
MASIVELLAGELPPKGAYWAMVVVNAVDATRGTATIRHTMGATFYTSPTSSEIDRTIIRASAWADAHGVESVYVCRLGIA